MPRNKALTREVIAPANRRELYITWSLAILLVIMANLAAMAFLNIRPREQGIYLLSTRYEMMEKSSYDWLIFGDSSIRHGINPALFEENDLGTAINLATFGEMTVINNAWMLARYIELQGPPKHVLIGNAYDVLVRDLRQIHHLAWVPAPLSFWKKYTPEFEVTGLDYLHIILTRYLPLYYRESELQVLLTHPNMFLQSKPRDFFTDRENGFQPLSKTRPEYVVNHDRPIQRQTIENADGKFAISETNLIAYRTIFELAERYSFDVYIANTYVDEIVINDPEFFNFYDQYRKQLTALTDKYQNVHYIHYDPMTFPPEKLQSFHHVSEKYVDDYTQALIDEIKEVLSNRAGNEASSDIL